MTSGRKILPVAEAGGSGSSLLTSGEKILLHPSRVRQLLAGAVDKVFPVSAHVYLTNSCNHDCSYCSEIVYRRDYPAKLRTDLAYSLMGQLAEVGTKSVVFIGGGEPTLHKDYQQIVLSAVANGLQVGLVTNGSRESMLEVAEHYSWVRVSMDGGTPELYSKIRRVPEDEFDKVLTHIWAMRQGCLDLVIGVQFLIATAESIDVLPAFLKRLSRAGVTYANVKVPVAFDWFSTDHMRHVNLDLPSSVGGMRVYVTHVGSEDGGGNAGLPCWASRMNATISADGKLHVCCRLVNTGQYDAAYLGDLNEQSFRDLWTSQFVVDKATGLLDPKNTRNCPECWMTRYNKALADVLPEDLASMDFV